MEQHEFFRRHLSDLAARAERTGRCTCSDFLNLAEQDEALSLRPSFGNVDLSFTGGAEGAERKIAVFTPKYDPDVSFESPIEALAISPLSEKFGEELSHRDYLGAVLALGIERALTGDIIVQGKHAWLLCLASISDFLIENLHEVRHTAVRVTRADEAFPVPKPVLVPFRANVPSERLDAIAAAFTGLSRAKAAELFAKQLVFVNSRMITDGSRRLTEGDVLNVRGFGKAIYRGIDGTSKKGRLYVVLDKYA